jgi:hypothetical protein
MLKILAILEINIPCVFMSETFDYSDAAFAEIHESGYLSALRVPCDAETLCNLIIQVLSMSLSLGPAVESTTTESTSLNDESLFCL